MQALHTKSSNPQHPNLIPQTPRDIQQERQFYLEKLEAVERLCMLAGGV